MKAATFFKIGASLLIVAASFFTTLTILKSWAPNTSSPPAQAISPLQEPSYNAETLPHLSEGHALDFSNGQNKSALLSGWAAPEDQFVWTSGHSAFIAFILDIPTGSNAPKQIILEANPFLVPGQVLVQRFQVWYHNLKLGDYARDSEAPIKIPLDGLSLKDGTPIVLGLVLPDAKSPRELKISEDSRVVALAVKRLALSP